MIFKCQQFDINQSQNLQKVGSDSMLLGALPQGNFKQILDIGTGTGLLALMQAQNHLNSIITGIEPHEQSFIEARSNFKNSKFNSRLIAIQSKLQNFEPNQLFDLIISNPPYFDNSTLSGNKAKNNARHTIGLSIESLYEHVNRLLNTNGLFYIVFPFNTAEKNFNSAKLNGFYPKTILRAVTENGKVIRYFVSFSSHESKTIEQDIIIKYGSGKYSQDYIHLTKPYYLKDLTNFQPNEIYGT